MGIIVVVIIALAIFVSTFDVNKYKPQVEQRISAAVGYNLKIDGDLGLKIFPSISVEVKGLHLENPEVFKAQAADLVYVEKANVGLALMPLLSKRFEFNDIVLTGVNLNLITPENGEPNWNLNAYKVRAAQEADLPEPVKNEAQSGDSATKIASLLHSLSFHEISVKNTRVVINNLATKSLQNFDNIDFTCGPFNNTSKPLNFSLSANMNNTPLSVKGQLTSIDSILNGAVPFDVDVTFDKLNAKAQGQYAALSDPMLDATVSLPAFNPKDIIKSLMPNVPAIIANSGPNAFAKLETTQKIKMAKGGVISFEGPYTFDQTSGTITGTFTNGALNAKVSASQVHPATYVTNQPMIKDLNATDITADVKYATGAINASFAGKYNLSQTAGNVSGTYNNGAITAKVSANQLRPADFITGQPMLQNLALSGLNADVKVNGGAIDASFSSKYTFEQSSGSVSGSFNNRNNLQNVTVNLDGGGSLNLDTLLAKTGTANTGGTSGSGSATSGGGTSSGSGAKKPILDPQTFGKLNIAAQVKQNSLVFKGLTLNSVNANVKLNQGAANATFSANSAGGGSISGSFAGNLTAQNAQKTLTAKTNNLQLQPVLKALMNKDLIAAPLNADVNVSGGGTDVNDMKRSLSGSVNATINKGQIHAGPGLSFNSIVMNLAFTNGNGQVTKGNIDSQIIAADITGNINLANDTLDITVQPTKAMPVDAASSIVDMFLPTGQSFGLTANVPFRIHGPFSKLSFDAKPTVENLLDNLNLKDLQENIKDFDVKNLEENLKGNLKENLEQGLKDKLDEAAPGAGGLLEGLFNRNKDKDKTEVTTQQPAQPQTTQPAEQPAQQPAQQQTTQPAEQPAQQPAQQQTTQPAEQQTTQPAEQQTTQPAEQPEQQKTDKQKLEDDLKEGLKDGLKNLFNQ